MWYDSNMRCKRGKKPHRHPCTNLPRDTTLAIPRFTRMLFVKATWSTLYYINKYRTCWSNLYFTYGYLKNGKFTTFGNLFKTKIDKWVREAHDKNNKGEQLGIYSSIDKIFLAMLPRMTMLICGWMSNGLETIKIVKIFGT